MASRSACCRANDKPLALTSRINNAENQCIIRLCTSYCYCINIGSDIGCSVPIPILVKNAIRVADIVADPIIGTPLVQSTTHLYVVTVQYWAAIRKNVT